MSLLKKLAGQTAIYGLSSIVGRLLNYLLVPLYTSKLSGFSLADYGIVTELYAFVAFLNILYIYGLETAYFRFSEKEDDGRFFDVAFTSILVTSFIFSGMLWLLAQPIADLLQYPDKSNYIKWLGLILAVDAVVAIPFAKLREEGKAATFAIFKLVNIGLNISLNLFFILLCPWVLQNEPDHFLSKIFDPTLGVGYVFLSNLIANAFYLLLFMPLWRKVNLRIDLKEWKRMISYAWPILIIGFAGVTNEMLSRAMLKYRLPDGFYANYSNLEILGIFGACYKLSVFMTLVVQAFRYAFEPFFFAQAKNKDSPEVFAQIMTYFVLFVSFGWMILCLFVDEYAPIFLRQESYLLALDAVPWLLGGGLLLGVFYNLSLWYKLTDNTRYGALISVIGAIATVILNWILIPAYGYMGSAYATFCTYLLMTSISFLWGRKHYPVPYRLDKIFLYIGLAGLGIFVNDFFDTSLVTAFLITLLFLTLAFLLERRNLSYLKN